MAVRRCKGGCGNVIPADAHLNQVFCDGACRNRWHKRKQRREARDPERLLRSDAKPLLESSVAGSYLGRGESKDGRASARRGPGYEVFVKTEFPEMLLRGEAKPVDVAGVLDTSAANVSRWQAAYAEDKANNDLRKNWSRGPEVEEALENFGAFCRRYWPEDQVTGFHMEWADTISEAIDEGGRAMLLAAQRHGKSSLLRKYCAWRICRDPDIRILWVSQTMDLATKSVGYVLDILGQHEKLAEEVLGPGGSFRPPQRNNMSWTSEEFSVGCRTKVQASPTMVALGKGGSILSRDADVLIVDDMQEHKHIRSPGQRETDVEWFFSDLMSRKLPNTGLAVIGSRQHLQDIYSEIFKRGEQWTIKVYPVHDPLCTIPEDDHERHTDCMLWPEQYPHEYMEEQRAQQGEAYFQRNMMNNPKDDATVLVSARDLERTKDHSRRLGELPKNYSRLIAGIDPADAKPVAAVLWAVEPDWGDRGRRHVIDTMEADAGIRGARQILTQWRQRYGVTLFVVEKNMAASWFQDAEIRDFCAREGVQIKPHWTDRINKWHDTTGVTAMFGRMRTDPPSITVPYADKDAQRKMDRLHKCWMAFDPDFAGNKHADDDLVMASWFPQPTMDNWTNQQTQQAAVTYMQTAYTPGRAAYVPAMQPKRHLEAVG